MAAALSRRLRIEPHEQLVAGDDVRVIDVRQVAALACRKAHSIVAAQLLATHGLSTRMAAGVLAKTIQSFCDQECV